jgi:hypothetical protein
MADCFLGVDSRRQVYDGDVDSVAQDDDKMPEIAGENMKVLVQMYGVKSGRMVVTT